MDLIFTEMNHGACKTYLIGNKGTEKAVLVDPVLEHVNDYLDYLKKNNLSLACVIDTHTHADHISGAASLKDMTGCDYLMHGNSPSKCVTRSISNGEILDIAGLSFEVMESFGHTRDSISLIMADRILTGDALFLDDGGAGRNDLPGGDPAQHWETLQQIKNLDNKLIVYPAHEYRERKPSSLHQQKKTNPHLKERSREEFIQYLDNLRLGPADCMKDVLKANHACARDPKAAWIPVDSPACEVKGTLEIGVNEQQPSIISVEELKERMGGTREIVLLDVREKHELQGPLGHLPGIIHIPIGKLPRNLSRLNEGAETVIICHSGARAYTAGQIMKQAGFKRVHVLDGGMKVWRLLEKS